MISWNELRIGNFVQSSDRNGIGGIVKVNSIDKHGINYFISQAGFEYECMLIPSKEKNCIWINPIILSCEILEKSDFEKEERGTAESFDGTEVVYHKSGIDIYYNEGFAYATYTRYPGRGFKAGVIIKYVHHLQNLFFALSGDELSVQF